MVRTSAKTLFNPYHAKGYSWLVSTSAKHDYSCDHSKCSTMPSGTIVNVRLVSMIKSNMTYILRAHLYSMCGHVGLLYWASPMMLHSSSFKNKSATNKIIVITRTASKIQWETSKNSGTLK